MRREGTWSMGRKIFAGTPPTSAQFLLKQSIEQNIYFISKTYPGSWKRQIQNITEKEEF